MNAREGVGSKKATGSFFDPYHIRLRRSTASWRIDIQTKKMTATKDKTKEQMTNDKKKERINAFGTETFEERLIESQFILSSSSLPTHPPMYARYYNSAIRWSLPRPILRSRNKSNIASISKRREAYT